jgi:DNA-directed RNA polymerase subunit RPC12/RpoP
MSMMFNNKPKEGQKEGQSAASKAFGFMMGNKQQTKPLQVQPKPAPKPVEETPKSSKIKYQCKHCGTEYSRDPAKYTLIVCPWCGKKHEE